MTAPGSGISQHEVEGGATVSNLRKLLALSYIVLTCVAACVMLSVLAPRDQLNRFLTILLSTEGLPPALLSALALVLYASRRSYRIWRTQS
jgi:hypothetical protein